MKRFKPKRDDFKIDPLRLDEHCLDQPELMSNYCEQLADARRDLDQAKADLEVCEAKLKRQILLDPKAYDLPAKPTVDAIKSTVITDNDYRNAHELVTEAKYLVDLLQGSVKSLDDRRRSLEALIDLHGQGYWSKPKVDGLTNSRKERQRKRRARTSHDNDD